MKKFNLVKGLSTVVVAMALAVGFTLPAKAAPAAPTITLKNTVKDGQVTTGWRFTFSDLAEGQRIMFNAYYGDDPVKNTESGYWDWNEDKTKGGFSGPGISGTSTEYDTQYTLSSDRLDKPGKKKVVAYIYDQKAYDEADNAYWGARQAIYNNDKLTYEQRQAQLAALVEPDWYDYISPASNAVDINATWEAGSISTVVKSTSIQLKMNTNSSWTTGYEIYRKVGSKFKKVATVASNTYNDQGLLSKTEYSYKVRPYYKDTDLNTTVYGQYTQLESTTKGSALKLKLTVQKTKNVKLTWKKVPGAVKYEVYRSIGYSDSTEISKGDNNGYGQYRLIKTLGKNKKSYVDKKTAANHSYSYTVRAVLSADKKVKGDKDTYIEDSAGVSFSFSAPDVYAIYEDAYGNRTIEWNKGYGIDGYIVEKQNPETEQWSEVKRLGKSTTKYKFEAAVTTQPDGTVTTRTRYRICAYKGAVYSSYNSYSTNRTLGMVGNVTAKKVANGVQVSWSAVPGASYYKVFRKKSTALEKNSDIGGYEFGESDGEQVTEYVGATTPVAVDVAAWNAPIEAWKAARDAWDAYYGDTTNTVPRPTVEYPSWDDLPWYGDYKLDATKSYYYQNYQYEQDVFTGTSCVDYYGDVYGGWYEELGDYNNNGEWVQTGYAAMPIAEDSWRHYEGPEEGVSYQYYVIAYADTVKTFEDYKKQTPWNSDEYLQKKMAEDAQILAATPGTVSAAVVGTKTLWKENPYMNTVGCKKITSDVRYTTVKAPGKAKISSLKAAKKSVTVKIKKVKGAAGYKIYRSTKKKGKYMCVGTSTKVTFKDTGLTAGTTYYYKVVAITKAESGADIEGKASAVKSVKAK